MTRVNSMRRRVLAGAALLGLIAPSGAMAQETLPDCRETVTVGESYYSAWLASNDNGEHAFMMVSVPPSGISLAPGASFADGVSVELDVPVRQGALEGSTMGLASFELKIPFVLRDGVRADAAGATVEVKVDGQTLAAAGEEQGSGGQWFNYNAQSDSAALRRGVRGDIEVTVSSAGNRLATLVFPGQPVRAGLADYGRLQSKLQAQMAARQCEIQSTNCFLTTAACEVVGLADNCWELRTLRRFRDGWLAKQADGRADIARYYAEAPAIADRLRADPKAALKLYWTRIVPSAVAAQLGLNRIARAIYTRGMRELAA